MRAFTTRSATIVSLAVASLNPINRRTVPSIVIDNASLIETQPSNLRYFESHLSAIVYSTDLIFIYVYVYLGIRYRRKNVYAT